MAVPPPPTGEFEGFSFPPATFAAGGVKCDTDPNSAVNVNCLQGRML